MTDAPAGLSIDFAAIAGEEEANPQGAADKTLARIDPTRPLETFSCRVDLTEAQLESVRKYARNLVASFKADRTKLSSFGDTALDDLNLTVSKILNQQGDLRIPDVERATKEMAKTVADFRRKYKDADPKLLEALDKFVDSIRGIFQTGNRFFRELQIDSQSAVERLDGVAAKLVENKATLDRNVILCDELYSENEKGLTNLIGIIAMQEQVLDYLIEDADELKGRLASTAKGSTAHRATQEELNLLLEMIEELEVRKSEFISRLFIAWVTSPQIRNLRKVSNSLSQRLHLLVVLTIPVMKLEIAKLGMELQAKEAGRAIDTVVNITNDAVSSYADSSAETVPELALLSQKPSITPTTILALADSVVAQNNGFVGAIRVGQQARATLSDVVVKSLRTIHASNEETQAITLELITQSKQPLELEAAPAIPDAVIKYDLEQQAV